MQHRPSLQLRRRWHHGRRRYRRGRRFRRCDGRAPLRLTLRQDADQHGRGILGLRGSHLPCRIAVEVYSVGADYNGLQLHTPLRVDLSPPAESAPIEIRQCCPDVGGNPDFQRSMRQVLCEHEGLRKLLRQPRQSGVDLLFPDGHPQSPASPYSGPQFEQTDATTSRK